MLPLKHHSDSYYTYNKNKYSFCGAFKLPSICVHKSATFDQAQGGWGDWLSYEHCLGFSERLLWT